MLTKKQFITGTRKRIEYSDNWNKIFNPYFTFYIFPKPVIKIGEQLVIFEYSYFFKAGGSSFTLKKDGTN